ncbi:MAG: hypothetical protein HETSPECPRED_010091 [Heterodermia speciosa]|uniref:PHD-type domain-containing protein n=1 Tax=Heterodermia speciosa TaxID=116794 RepID=A0A8H3ERY4_9LECA|nr:MAG: hypothetical protein HETSPECPRED_010091 [Heterodermia speciosa]
MPARKRGRAEMESSAEPAQSPQDDNMLVRLRNMWEFSNLMQYIFIFGKAVKIDEDFDIEDLETECLKPEPSEKLSEIGLALLKYVSSHRGLTPEIFDEYTRRQYLAKAPARNPFGDDEEPKKFVEFDVFTKLRILFQLSQWTLINAERMRERMPEVKDAEQTQWRIEEIGYDKQDRLYYVLDDNRLYRRTDPPPPSPPPPKPKANSKKGKAAARASKRRKTAEAELSTNDADGEGATTEAEKVPIIGDGFGGRKWECIAVTLTEYQTFLDTIRKSKDPDEKALLQRIADDILPVIEKAEESQLRKQARKERELSTMHKLATAKRSSRLASKQEKEREEQEAAEAERKKRADLAAAKADQEKQKKMEEARENRMMTREQRLKEREYKRILQEEELASLSEDNKKLDAGEARLSERHLKAEMEKRKKELAALAEEDEWTFDCSVCGVHGENIDDGSHSIACEKCNVWQHSACHGISQAAAEKDDFHFICNDCKRRAEDALKPKIPSLKFHVGSASSPPSQKNKDKADLTKKRKSDENGPLPPMKKFKHVEVNGVHSTPQSTHLSSGQPHIGQNRLHDRIMNGPTLSPQGQVNVLNGQTSNGLVSASPPPGLRSPPGPPAYSNGYTHHVSSQNGYAPHTYSEAPTNDVRAQNSPQNTTWSATYQSRQSANTPQQAQPVPPSANPFHNSFGHHLPNSVLSPLAGGPASSHARQTYTPANASNLHLPTINGLPSQTYSLPPPLPPPVKHQSPPPAPIQKHILSSSPTAGPNLEPQVPPSPGFSPTKRESPRAVPPEKTTTDPALSPILQQAPRSPGLSPVKQRSPRPAPLANGLNDPSSSPIAGPALLNRNAPSPGFSPTKQSPPRPPPLLSNGVVPPVEALNPSPPHE